MAQASAAIQRLTRKLRLLNYLSKDDIAGIECIVDDAIWYRTRANARDLLTRLRDKHRDYEPQWPSRVS